MADNVPAASSGSQISQKATSAPQRASSMAIACPMPRAPPVTNATLPLSDGFEMLQFYEKDCAAVNRTQRILLHDGDSHLRPFRPGAAGVRGRYRRLLE